MASDKFLELYCHGQRWSPATADAATVTTLHHDFRASLIVCRALHLLQVVVRVLGLGRCPVHQHT